MNTLGDLDTNVFASRYEYRFTVEYQVAPDSPAGLVTSRVVEMFSLYLPALVATKVAPEPFPMKLVLSFTPASTNGLKGSDVADVNIDPVILSETLSTKDSTWNGASIVKTS